MWNDDAGSAKPHLIITSEKVSKEYLTYLDEKHISWIACGKEKIDLKRAVELLAEVFAVEARNCRGTYDKQRISGKWSAG